MRVGPIDPECISKSNRLPELTPRQAAAHTWRPAPALWEAVKKRSVERPATITFTGYAADGRRALSRGSVTFRTSRDPVGAPVFYRDVPLMPTETEQGRIKPLAPQALPLVNWRLKSVGERGSRLLLTGMPVCANCHSFSDDGKTMGMDLDGLQNELKCGTFCGGCLPEVKKIIVAKTSPQAA